MLEWIKYCLAKKEINELGGLKADMARAYRWCAEFDQMCDLIDYLRKVDRIEDISCFRDRMRKKYSNKSEQT